MTKYLKHCCISPYSIVILTYIALFIAFRLSILSNSFLYFSALPLNKYIGWSCIKMTRKILAVILAVLMLATVLAACGGDSGDQGSTPPANSDQGTTPPANSDKPDSSNDTKYTIKWASINAQGSVQDEVFETPFKEYIEEVTDGRIELEIYYSGALSGQGTTFEAIVNETTDAGFDNPDNYTGLFPYTLLYASPGWYFGDSQESYETLLAYADVYQDPYMADNFKVIAWGISPGIGLLTTNEEFKEASQWNGFSVRSLASQVDWLSSMGANCVSMGIADVYESFRLNVIGGCITGIVAFKSFSFPEVCNYYTWLPMLNGATSFVFSKPLYDSFDPELQAALDDAFAYAQENLSMADIDAQAAAAKAYVDEVNPNFKYVDMTDEEINKMCEYAEPLLQEYVATLDGQGLDGTGAFEWLKAHAK